jgi:hypothetical protein
MSDDEIPTVLFGIPTNTLIKAVAFAADWGDAGQRYDCRSHNRTVRFTETELRLLRAANLVVAE